MDKTQFAADLENGQEVASLFLIASASQGQARNGPFWRLELRDATGSLEAKIWSPQSGAFPKLAAGDIVAVEGRVTMFRERLEIAVERMRILTEPEKVLLDLAQFMPASKRPALEMMEDLRRLARKVLTHKAWRKLAVNFLEDPEIEAMLLLAPAAKGMHHAYAGGLLEHTLGVCRLCLSFAELYPQLDRQTLFVGALFHDMGKLWELTGGLTIDYTDAGKLLGHMHLVLEKLEPLMKKAGLEEDSRLHLKHLVLSHHGQLEYGSPRLPSTAEAMALHYADNLDAKLNQIGGALEGLGDAESGWSNYVPSLERSLYRAPATPGPFARATRKNGQAEPEQCSLLTGS